MHEALPSSIGTSHSLDHHNGPSDYLTHPLHALFLIMHTRCMQQLVLCPAIADSLACRASMDTHCAISETGLR